MTRRNLLWIFVACSLVLTGCSSFNPPVAVKDIDKTCEQLRSILQPYGDVLEDSIEVFENEDSAALLLSESSRQRDKEFILSTYPFFANYSLADMQEYKYENGPKDVYLLTSLMLLEQANIDPGFSKKELKQISESETAYEDIVEPFIDRIVGPNYEEPAYKTCATIDDANPELDYTQEVTELWNNALGHAHQLVGKYYGVISCEQTGYVKSYQCATEDYDSSGTDYSDAALCGDQTLSTTANTAEPGVTCGVLNFEVFQSDLNTGSCLAMIWWTDANGNEDVGAMHGCGFQEGSYYEQIVKVGQPYTYITTMGVESTVVGFTLVQ